MVENDQGKFTILVGSVAKPLGLSLRDEAVKQALAEDEKAAGKGIRVTLLEQTADHGAVSVPFRN